MNKLSLTALVLSLAACQPDTKTLEKKIDDQAKDIREIKAMIAKGGGGAGAAQKGQQQAREEAAPDAVFAVDISTNLKKGMIEGPSTALVTIVEAWDFA
ncbi:MAG: hypothetical protein IPQ07_37070 [Myxococcales bacterium]|nr:hypothetical protein [Myxococcales bacterium]